MGYRETATYSVFEVDPGQTLDLVIDIGKSPSQIAAGEPDVLFRQNCLYAGQDDKGVWHPIGHAVKDGKLYQEYWREYPWSAFILPKSGKAYIGALDIRSDISWIKLAFIAGPRLLADGVNVARAAAVSESTASDIAGSVTNRTGIGIKRDGTLLLVTTPKAKLSLREFGDLMRSLGAWDALNLDGGGSTASDMDNVPSQNERATSSALIVRGKGKTVMKKKLVVIDAGHGGRDPGAQANGLREKDFNLNMAHKVAWYLQQKYEVDVVMTRTDDTFVELDARADIANQINADLFYSIHANAAGNNQRGFETFVYNGQRTTETGKMQDIVHAELYDNLLKQLGMPDRGKKTADFRVLHKTNMPAILTEYGFVDNLTDAVLLKDPTVVEPMAVLTADGIAKALALPRKAQPVPVPVATPAPVPEAQHWAQAAHDRLRAAGVLDSDHSGSFDKPASEGMVIQMIDRLFKELKGGDSR